MQTMLGNLRYAVRQLLRTPTFTIVTILTLALGVGANTAIFSVIQAVLLHPAGIDDPTRVVSFHARYTQLNLSSIGVSAPDFTDAQSLNTLVDSAALVQTNSFNAVFNGRTQHLNSAMVSWKWFQVFGAQPILGRTFLPEEDQKGNNHVAVLSYAAWQRLFGGQRDAIGKTILLDDKSFRIIGVMRSDFGWPRNQELLIPLGLTPEAYNNASERFNEFYDSAVRLKPGVQISQFNSALEQKRLEEIRLEGTSGFGLRDGWSLFAQPWTQDAAGDLRKPLFALFAVVAMVLLIACANISGLMLARASSRARELAIRTALGASLSQLAVQFFVETALLAGVATLIGIVVGPLLGRALLLVIPNDLATGFVVHRNFGIVCAAAAFGLLAIFLAGLAPVLQLARSHRSLRLAEYGRSSGSAPAKQRFRSVLVCTEVALAFLLVAGTGLFLASLKQLERVDPGFTSEGVLTGNVTLNASNYSDQRAKRADFVRNVTSRLVERPGVVAAGAVYPLPFGKGVAPSGSFDIQDRPTAPNEAEPHSDKRWATPGYLAALQIPLLSGRWFTAEDSSDHPPVVVIDDVLARAYWPGRNPIGQRLRSGSKASWAEIVGVVGHTRRDSLEVDENKGVIYRSMAQSPVEGATFVLRTKIDPESMKSTLVEAVQSADATEAIYDIRTLDSLVSDSLAARHLMVWLLTLFGGLALLLAAIGIYGLLSFTANQRTTEIGIRMALGAQRSQVVSLVLRQSFTLIVIGISAGFALTIVAQKILIHNFAAMKIGILPSLLMAALGLFLSAILAAAVPARRSASVDPATVLRSE
jgi:predicted permease